MILIGQLSFQHVSTVTVLMSIKCRLPVARKVTQITFKGFLSCMSPQMAFNVIFFLHEFTTYFTLMREFSRCIFYKFCHLEHILIRLDKLTIPDPIPRLLLCKAGWHKHVCLTMQLICVCNETKTNLLLVPMKAIQYLPEIHLKELFT